MAQALALTLVLADAATEGKKVITGMLILGLVIASVPVIGESYRYFKYFRRGRMPHE